MPSYEALNEANEVLAQSGRLVTAVDREIVALDAARQAGAESLTRVHSTAAAGATFVASSGADLGRGRALSAAAGQALAEGAMLQRELWSAGLAPNELRPPAVAASVVQRLADPSGPRVAEPAPLPDFAAPSRDALWQDEPRTTRRAEVWDTLAESLRTLRELEQEALARLDEAERELELAEAAVRQTRPEGADREHRERTTDAR